MRELSQLIAEIGNRIGNESYYLLYLAVEEAVKTYPKPLHMKTLCGKIMVPAGKSSPGTAYRSLVRSVDNIWAREESHEVLAKYYRRPLLEKPKPKDLISTLARYLCEEDTQAEEPVTYSVYESICPPAYGVLARAENAGLYTATAPFSKERGQAEELVRLLNRQNMPFEQFKALFLSGKFPNA